MPLFVTGHAPFLPVTTEILPRNCWLQLKICLSWTVSSSNLLIVNNIIAWYIIILDVIVPTAFLLLKGGNAFQASLLRTFTTVWHAATFLLIWPLNLTLSVRGENKNPGGLQVLYWVTAWSNTHTEARIQTHKPMTECTMYRQRVIYNFKCQKYLAVA